MDLRCRLHFRLGNLILYGDTPDGGNEDDTGDPSGVDEYNNQEEITGVTTSEEEIPEVDIPEEEDENAEITGVDQNTEDPGVNHTKGGKNAMHGNPPGPIPTKDKNTPKVETVDKSNSE